MADLGRKNFGEKVDEKLTPDSDKTNVDKVKEQVTNKVDDFAAKATPEDQKSFPQTVADSAKQGHDDAKQKFNENEGTLADTATSYIDSAKEQVSKGAEYLSGVATGAAEGAKKGGDKS